MIAALPLRNRDATTMCDPRLTERSCGRAGSSSVRVSSVKMPVALMTTRAEMLASSPLSSSRTTAPETFRSAALLYRKRMQRV
jgi:hypothetical protein